jgi:low affinity Fe/Cu permease
MDRPPQRGLFDRIAERASEIVGQASFFMGSLALVLLWIPMAFVVHSIDTWQLVLSTLTSVAAFLLIALLQNSERRSDRAMHQKIDALAAALAEHLREQEADEETVRGLDDAVGLEERL